MLAACKIARENKIEIIIDAVLNVIRFLFIEVSRELTNWVLLQHKMGADHSEIFSAVPVDPQNRLKDIGPVREVEVRILPSGFTASQSVAI